MTPLVRITLTAIVLGLIGIEYAWSEIDHFDIDIQPLGAVFVFAAIPLAVGIFYAVKRPDRRLSAAMFALAFLLILAPLCTILNYFAVSVAGNSIDDLLARADRAIGIDWPSLVLAIAHHPVLMKALSFAYSVSAFQIAIPIILLGFDGDPLDISRLCIATAICALLTIAFWTIFPSFGAYTVYNLRSVTQFTHIVLDDSYPKFLLNTLAHGPGHINPANAKGLVGFPSFHTEEIVLAAWYLRKRLLYFVPALLFGALALLSVPIQGGHHVVDLAGGILFAAGGIALANTIINWLTALENKAGGAAPTAAERLPTN